jgi:hypothetical protein
VIHTLKACSFIQQAFFQRLQPLLSSTITAHLIEK